VREFRTLGSVRGAAREGGPYRNLLELPCGQSNFRVERLGWLS
jgi:hypothetical protein